MRWQGNRQSGNVEDRRGSGRRVAVAGVPIGCGTLLLAVLFIALGGDPQVVLQVLGDAQLEPASGPSAPADPNDPTLAFVRTVLADTEDVWDGLFRAQGATYPRPTLVVFDRAVQSACGAQSASTGPFYCPADRTVYLDPSFFALLRDRFRAPGDFAAAYVIGHEVGHHVQNVLGAMDEVSRAQRANPGAANELSVRLELQADCYAGVWAHHANVQRQLLEEGDVEEGLRAAAAIGDDAIQRSSGGRVAPESFTHGSSEQRVTWFGRGLKTGQLSACDTFGG